VRVCVCVHVCVHVLRQRSLLVGQNHPLNVEDEILALVNGRWVDPDRVPHALAHGTVVFVHHPGVLESQSSALHTKIVLEGVASPEHRSDS